MTAAALSPESIPWPVAASTSAEKSPLASDPGGSPDAASGLPEGFPEEDGRWSQVLAEWRDLRRVLTLDLLSLTESIRTRRSNG